VPLLPNDTGGGMAPAGIALLGEARGGKVAMWQALERGGWELSAEPTSKVPAVRVDNPYVLENGEQLEHHLEAVIARACQRDLVCDLPTVAKAVPKPVQLRLS